MQGFNMGRYHPPDGDGAAKPPDGRRRAAPTVRFEMPFAVWCASCPRPTLIGQGVRFNAEKRRVGAYLTTPLWSFRFRHADCGGALEIRTDPRNTAYVVVSGGTRRADADADADADDADAAGAGANHDAAADSAAADRDARRQSAFASLEKTIADRAQLRRADGRIVGLLEASARHWLDPYAQNQRLRGAFRADRARRERDDDAARRLRRVMGLAFDLLPADDDDARRAAGVAFGRRLDPDGAPSSARSALRKPLFSVAPAPASSRQPPPPSSASSSSGSSSASRPPPPPDRDAAPASIRASLASELVANIRAAQDPFLLRRRRHRHPVSHLRHSPPADAGAQQHPPAPAPRLLGVKRKRAAGSPPVEGRGPAREAGVSGGLVQYDSD